MFIICCLMFVDELPIARMDVLFFRYRYPNDLTRRILKPYEVGPRHLYILMCIYIYILYSDSNYYHSYSSYYY